MAEAIHEMAPHHLPPFIVAPGETDSLYILLLVSLIAVVLFAGIIYFKLHALPEKMAHGANSTQLQLVGVLALLAMFTHNNIFWIAALLLAAFRIPDFSAPLAAISRSVDGLAERIDRSGASEAAAETLAEPPAPEPPTPEPPAPEPPTPEPPASGPSGAPPEPAASAAPAEAERKEAGDA